jgi:excisionase family DNA binding protein
MDRLLLTPVEAARALGIGRTKVYELMAGGTLRSVKMGTAGGCRPRRWASSWPGCPRSRRHDRPAALPR